MPIFLNTRIILLKNATVSCVLQGALRAPFNNIKLTPITLLPPTMLLIKPTSIKVISIKVIGVKVTGVSLLPLLPLHIACYIKRYALNLTRESKILAKI